MMIIRPVREDDRAAIVALASKTGVGFTSLPKNENRVKERIERMLKTWNKEASQAEQGYLFVLEDTELNKVVGVSGVEVAIGLDEPWYNYRVGTLVHASKELSVYSRMPTLFLTNDHTGYSELCTLFLDSDYRHSQNGYLLSKARFLFMAAFQDCFSERLIAEMRGYSDEQGRSPFWESLGRHFFSMDFAEADHLSGMGKKSFIAELMPKHPLYVDFLSEEARNVIGNVHPHTEPAAAILNSEGMKYEGCVDIFDAGPTLEAHVSDIRAVKESQTWHVLIDELANDPAENHVDKKSDTAVYILANENYLDFRAVLGRVSFDKHSICISNDIAHALGVNHGDTIRAVTLFPEEKA
ncbi:MULTISPECIES: arginine N-succinyltransferase [Vibrio]|uniref:Arginine N-succinyltransferase n=1 Tax=Vibrio casei TaxID=673372 RepID=A0A368LGZ0_9VIBR|nr:MULTISPECIES: arginine N-succinyltransferase [Vibrio]RCS70022.1 arginine N-succinyltransferase [Vibrio casei]SJN33847.1 Arginine N-succinyltransferase [Vibrio casei]HBV77475.1 arginine N-succinyltransferase [Vibrio sp.]